MSKPTIIIITGAPGTGKTTLGKKLSAEFKLPFISKDALKERMFDNLGWDDKTWSLKVSAASHRIMDYIIEEELHAQHSIIVESNFKKDIDSDRFRALQTKYSCRLVQILCWANGKVVYERFMNRMDTAERHAGHVEAISPDEIKRGFIETDGREEPLDIAGTTLELDTTDFGSVNYDGVYQTVKNALSKSESH